MSAPYLLSKTLDPIFALAIGSTAFYLRIRREETERWHMFNPSLTSPPPSAFSRVAGATHKAPLAIDERTRNLNHAPTVWDTWEMLKRRVKKLDLRAFDVSSMWRAREQFGIVEVNQ